MNRIASLISLISMIDVELVASSKQLGKQAKPMPEAMAARIRSLEALARAEPAAIPEVEAALLMIATMGIEVLREVRCNNGLCAGCPVDSIIALARELLPPMKGPTPVGLNVPPRRRTDLH